MDKVTKYQSIIMETISRYAHVRTSALLSYQTIYDRDNHHYLLYAVGWQKDKRVHGCIIHIDIIKEKIWIQHNGTDVKIAEEMITKGVLREDIILAFYHPENWEYTNYGKDKEYLEKALMQGMRNEK